MASDSSDTGNAINLLLIGRTGNGKSSTGNSILGRKEFIPRSSTSSVVTYDVKAGTTSIDGLPVTVVEGPGLGDTDIDVTDDGQSMIGLSEKAMSLTSHKLHALLVVLKYGIRFTKQEKDAVKMIKTIFGDDVIKNYGITVMTYGDSFDSDMESDEATFEKWCDDQTGDVRILFDECDRRCVLFDNRSTDTEKVRKQREQLIHLVSGIMQSRLPYSEDDYRKAESSRRSLLVYGKLPVLNSKIERILSYINQQLDQIRKEEKKENTNLQKLSDELQEHKSWLEKEDEGTGLIKHLLIQITIAETRIKTMVDKEKKTEELRKELNLQNKGLQSEEGESKQLGLMSVVFLGHWSVIYFLVSTILSITPRHNTIVPSCIERLCDVYTIVWSYVLPSKVMQDKRVTDVRNQIKAKITQFRTQLNR